MTHRLHLCRIALHKLSFQVVVIRNVLVNGEPTDMFCLVVGIARFANHYQGSAFLNEGSVIARQI